ncbi:M24 family metallopeptidase [Acidicapsa dinghuensis]|uniref:M24 family metallopeptidase n=1 Tax=Acidicapsa dinghuensis TaxID=2218256 RepID=A0ABW1EDU7_9BACT|nr:Xaa-Pro peptidase family protein [Acidicapsa dinghuensis]
MLNRRRFLSAFAAAAAFPWLSSAARAQESAHESSTTSLPPALAALKNRRHEATPITSAEREQRFEHARELMGKEGIDAVVMIGGTSLVYFTGIRWWNSERLFVCVIPRKGAPFYVSPAFEEDRAREQIRSAPGGAEARVYTWQEDENPYVLVTRGLNDLGLTSGKIGIEERVTFVFSDGIHKAAPGFEIVSAIPITAGCRAVKSSAELKLMQLANDITLSVYEAAWKSIHPGITNAQVSEWIGAAYGLVGFPGDASCQVDEYSALPHGSIQPQMLKEGSIVLIDDGCNVDGYESDISRTFTIGKPTDKMKQVFDMVHRAQAAALAAAKPGVACGSVDAAARKVIDDAGFGPNYAHFTHRVGHGIGMDGHEWPYLVRGNPQLLQAGMCFSDEPGIYIHGEFGVRLEDDIHITEDGAKLFTPQSPSLEEPFANA